MNHVNRPRLQSHLCALCIILIPILADGQNAVFGALSSSDVQLSNHIRVSHTLGEPAIRRVKGQKMIISEGFQQGKWTLHNIPTPGTNDLSIYPNPSGDYIHIAVPQGEKVLQSVVLQNIQGIEIFRYPMQGNGHTVNVSHLVPGTYRLQGFYTDGHTSSVFQLIKQ
jgi:hypothetical protein